LSYGLLVCCQVLIASLSSFALTVESVIINIMVVISDMVFLVVLFAWLLYWKHACGII